MGCDRITDLMGDRITDLMGDRITDLMGDRADREICKPPRSPWTARPQTARRDRPPTITIAPTRSVWKPVIT